MSTAISTAISVDVAVDTRSTLGRLSIESRPTIDRVSTECRSSVDRYVDRQSIDCRSTGGRYSGRRTSTEYRSYVGDISANCRWYVGQLSVAYRSTVGRISVNCRSHISCVLIWYLAVTQDQSWPKLNLWLAYLKLFPRDAMPLSWKWAFRNTHQFFWALTCFIIPGSRFCGDHKCKLYVSALKAGTVHWLVRFKWEQQSV